MIHFLLVLHTIIFFMQKKKSSVSQNIFARDERLLFIKSYAVPLLFMNVTSYTYQIQALYIHIRSDISTLDNGWVPSASTLLNLSVQNLGQPLRGQFHLFFQLLLTNQQLSEFRYKCNNPLHSFFLLHSTRLPLSGTLVNIFSEFLCIIYTEQRMCLAHSCACGGRLQHLHCTPQCASLAERFLYIRKVLS